MMNKRSLKVIAWLLTLVMVFNIAPVSVLAEMLAGSNEVGNYQTITPGSDEYVVRYMIRGTYTTSGKDVRIADDTKGRMSASVMARDPNKINEERNNNPYKDVFNQVGQWEDPKTSDYDAENRVLTLYFKPIIHLTYHIYYYVRNEQGDITSTQLRNFGDLKGSNRHAGLESGEDLYVEKFITGAPDIDLVNETHKVDGLYIPLDHIKLDSTVYSTKNGADYKPYKIQYIGYSYDGNSSMDSLNSSTSINWLEAKQTTTHLYYWFDANGNNDGAESYTITWVNEDGTTLETDENVEEGTKPTYDGMTPTKADDETYYYIYKGWDKEIKDADADTTYTAIYSQYLLQKNITADEKSVETIVNSAGAAMTPEGLAAVTTEDQVFLKVDFTNDDPETKIGNRTRMIYDITIPEGFVLGEDATSGETNDVRWTVEDGKLIVTWKENTAPNTFTVNVPLAKKPMDELGLNGKEVYIAYNNGTILISDPINGTRMHPALSAAPYIEVDGNTIRPQGLYEKWTIEYIEGGHYAIRSASGYLNFAHGTASVSSEKQEVIIKTQNGKYAIYATDDIGGGKSLGLANHVGELESDDNVFAGWTNWTNNFYIFTFYENAQVTENTSDLTGTWVIAKQKSEKEYHTLNTNLNTFWAVPGEGDTLKPEYKDDLVGWTFTKVPGETNWYYVQSEAGYLNITDNKISVTTVPSKVYAIQGNNSNEIILTGGKVYAMYVASWNNAFITSPQRTSNDCQLRLMKIYSNYQEEPNIADSNYTFTAQITNPDGSKIVTDVNELDPTATYNHLVLDSTEKRGTYVVYPSENPLYYELQENLTALDGSNEDLSWTYDSVTRRINFIWKNGKQDHVSAVIDILPNVPESLGLDNQDLAIVTNTGTKGIVLPEQLDGGRIKSMENYVKLDVEDGYVWYDDIEDWYWHFEWVSGTWYKIKANATEQYLNISETGVTLSDNAQVLYLNTNNGNYEIGMAPNSYRLNTAWGDPKQGMQAANTTSNVLLLPITSETTLKEIKDGSFYIGNYVEGDGMDAWRDRNIMLPWAKSGNESYLAAAPYKELNSTTIIPQGVYENAKWTFVQEKRDWYYIKSSDGQYLHLSENGAYLSTEPKSWLVRTNGSGYEIMMASQTHGWTYNLVNKRTDGWWHGGAFTGHSTEGDRYVYLRLYSNAEPQWGATIASGVILNPETKKALTTEPYSDGRLKTVTYVKNENGTVRAEDGKTVIPTFTFTKTGKANWYYIQDENNNYLKVEKNRVTLSTSPAEVFIQEMDGSFRMADGETYGVNVMYFDGNESVAGYAEYDSHEKFVLGTTMSVQPLYNLAEVKTTDGSNYGWYRLQKTTILTTYPLEHYLEGLKTNDNKIIPEEEYIVDDYLFTDITIKGITYKYWTGKDSVPNNDNYYTVDEHYNEKGKNDYLVAVKDKISNSNNWIEPRNYNTTTDPNKTSSFHRNFAITLYERDEEMVEQPLFNMITFGDINKGGDHWYRLKKTTYTWKPYTTYNDNVVVQNKDGAPADPAYYDFTNYTHTENGITYIYKPDNVEYDNTVSYFTTEFIRIYVKSRISDGKSAKYLDDKDSEGYDDLNDTRGYHRDYKGYLTKATHGKYTIHHYLYGTETKVAEDTIGKDLIGSTLNAASAESFKEGYKNVVRVSDDGPVTIGYNADENVINVYYKVPVTLSAVDYEGIYDGAAHNGGATVSMTDGTTIEYSTDNGTTWTKTVPSIIDAGTVNYIARATNNIFDPVTANGTLTVTQKAVTVTGVDGSKVYGEADPAGFTATVDGNLNGDTIDYTVSREAGENAGHYDVIPTGAASQGNYSVTYV
ncbi:MAG: hypothetical protein IJG94_10465, partial [Clostridia bacterium]|nr:hypothetical protein [Clostridia bacterium]